MPMTVCASFAACPAGVPASSSIFAMCSTYFARFSFDLASSFR